MSYTWTEVDSAITSPVESDLAFGPITTKTSMQGRVVQMLDNLPTQSNHYSLVPNYINEAKDELLTLALGLSRQVIDHLPRLRNWRWYTTTQDGQCNIPLPERMLWLDSCGYTKSTTAYDETTQQLLPINPYPEGRADQFALLSRSTSAAGYPVLYRRAGAAIDLWPTPSSSPTDYRTTIVASGTRMDKDLSADADTLLMPPRMQLLVLDLATVIAMEKMGWDEGPERRAQFMIKLQTHIAPSVKERTRVSVRTRIAGTPR